MDGGVMGWTTIWEDADKRVDRDDDTGAQRTVYANPNEETLRQQARTAMDANRTFLALTAPTAAQNAQQIKALTRQVQALIRFTLDDLSGTD
jgi:hypothetical protein